MIASSYSRAMKCSVPPQDSYTVSFMVTSDWSRRTVPLWPTSLQRMHLHSMPLSRM